MRSTALRTREEITITNITKLPSGRGLATEFRGIWMINIYAPSGAAKKEREQFFDSELADLLRASPTSIIVGGDFNCILHQKDSTGNFNYSRALGGLVHVFELLDMWQADPPENGYTFFPYGCDKNRPDMYYERAEYQEGRGIDSSSSFHRPLSSDTATVHRGPIIRRGRGLWKMNISLFDEEMVKEKFQQQWAIWRQQRRIYPVWPMLWGRYAKKNNLCFCIQVGS